MLKALSEILSLQSKGSITYPEGIFPSQRKHYVTGTSREDDNSFFTALIVFTLQRLKKYFSAEELKIAEDIEQHSKKAFPLFESKKVNGTYNFWRTEKNAHFPNGNIFSKLNRFALADDADCTALVYLAKGYSNEDILNLKNKLIRYSTLPVKISNNTLPHYRNLKLYSTWFGKYIPIETDVCVTANILYLLFESKTTFSRHDTDSIQFIYNVILKNEHKTHEFRIAPYYPKTSVILYHICRLYTIAGPIFVPLKSKLKTDILEKLSENIHPMERVILNTSLIWLGENNSVENLEMPTDINFPWFIAGILTSINNPIAKLLSSSPLFHLQFYCEAYMKTLFLEYKTLRDNRNA